MNRVVTVALLLLASLALPAYAGHVAVAISVGAPDFYGRVDLGEMRPRLIYTAPVIIERRPAVVLSPIYLRVPRGHLKHWRKHCRDYDACGRPVYFVDDRWYTDEYVPHYRQQYSRQHDSYGNGNEPRRYHDGDEGSHGYGDGDNDHDHGHGHGKGHDKHHEDH